LELSVFSISHGERSDIDNHLETEKHKSSVEAAMSSSRVTRFFKTAHSDESLLLAAKKAIFVYHAAIYGQSFKVLIAISELVSKFFETKFAIARTKCESVIVTCVAPIIAAERCREFDKANFVSVTIDASKSKEQGRRRAGKWRGVAPLAFHSRGNGEVFFLWKYHR